MSKYYTGRRARHYNARWHTFNEITLGEALAMIDVTALRSVSERLGRCPRILDVACGTGILLSRLLDQVPGIEAYGVDASADMLAQASLALKGQLHVHIERAQIGAGETANLPYAQETFDLIACTNALHDMPEAVVTLAALGRLLAPGGQLVVEDFARREPLYLWKVFAWLLERIEGSHVHAYTLAEAQSLCKHAGLRVASGKVFKVDWLWHGWVLCAYRATSEAGTAHA
jgi:ubiquinone/menaquinone biosynthesis C-methylase UbiE